MLTLRCLAQTWGSRASVYSQRRWTVHRWCPPALESGTLAAARLQYSFRCKWLNSKMTLRDARLFTVHLRIALGFLRVVLDA